MNWVDLFTRLSLRSVIVDSLQYCSKNKGLEIYAYCIMSSHIHLLCRDDGEQTVSEIMRDFKKFTAKKIIETIQNEPDSRREWLLKMFADACEHLKRNQEFKVWQNGYYAEKVFSQKFIKQKINYIHNNPVKERIVENPEDYLFSSARNYSDLESVLEVVCLPLF
ncbi:REP-associated tyrosine transposase [Wenyingzhuangia sp. IMCC45574]